MSDSSVTLDKTIHEQARLKILVLLASSPLPALEFTQIRKSLGMTAGNLSIQLKTLESAGFVQLQKVEQQRKSITLVRLLESGRNALLHYVASLESLLSTITTEGSDRNDTH